MTKPTWKARVASATVRLPNLGGQGVLVPGGLVLTATHCVRWSGTGRMTLGVIPEERVITRDGTQFRLGLACCDPVSDLAVLDELDNQEYGDDCAAFDEWQERVAPVPLSKSILGLNQSMPVFVLSHDGKWLTGTVTRHGVPWKPPSHRIALSTGHKIKSGTSGSPVVTEDGYLLGVISCDAVMPIAHLALPKWVMDRMEWKIPDDIDARTAEVRASLQAQRQH